MESNEKELIKRWTELSERAYSAGRYVYTGFLNTAEQRLLGTVHLRVMPMTEGGYPLAERKIAIFGNEELCGWYEAPPIVCIKISPRSKKFAAPLSHRDFLGSLTGLGITRDLLGDIAVSDNEGYLFCLEKAADFITSQLEKVGSTPVEAVLTEVPTAVASPKTEEVCTTAASDRLDCIICAVYGVSRAEGKESVEREKVSVNSTLCTDPSKRLEKGDVVSVRGKGRFIYKGDTGITKKGRLRVAVDLFAG